KEAVEQATSIYNQDKQSLSAVQERVSMLQKLLQEEPQLKQRLTQAQMDIAQVDRKLRGTILPPLPEGVVFSEELLDEANQLRNRVKPQVERYMGLILPVITSGRYKAVQLEEDYTVRVFDPEAGEFRPKEVFSGGTEDQLLLAMRLAFALALIPQAKGRNPE